MGVPIQEKTDEELYDLVWSEPMTTVCKRFGISDNGLRKHCKSMNIPTPISLISVKSSIENAILKSVIRL